MSLPQHLVQEHEDVQDHQNALSGYGRQAVHKGKAKRIGDQLLYSYRCRAKNRKGKGRRCKNMGRSTFPYCFTHSIHKLGTKYIDQGLIACRDFEKGEIIGTVKSIQSGEIKEKSVLYIDDEDDKTSVPVMYSKPNESTIGRYATQVDNKEDANSEYIVLEVEYDDKDTNQIEKDSLISLVCIKPIHVDEQIKVYI